MAHAEWRHGRETRHPSRFVRAVRYTDPRTRATHRTRRALVREAHRHRMGVREGTIVPAAGATDHHICPPAARDGHAARKTEAPLSRYHDQRPADVPADLGRERVILPAAAQEGRSNALLAGPLPQRYRLRDTVARCRPPLRESLKFAPAYESEKDRRFLDELRPARGESDPGSGWQRIPFPDETVEAAPVRRATEDSGCALAYPSGKGIAGGSAPPQPGEAAPILGRRT